MLWNSTTAKINVSEEQGMSEEFRRKQMKNMETITELTLSGQNCTGPTRRDRIEARVALFFLLFHSAEDQIHALANARQALFQLSSGLCVHIYAYL